MVYRLFVYDKRAKEWEKKSDYQTYQMAETKAKPFIEKGREVKIIAIPKEELCVGFKVYKDGDLYGTIVRESESFWYINRVFRDETDEALYLKDEFERKYENRIFHVKGECYDKDN